MSTHESDTVNEQNDQNEGENLQDDAQPVNEKEKQIVDLKLKANELNDKYLRLYSEFDNFRKRTAKEKIELIQTQVKRFLKVFYP